MPIIFAIPKVDSYGSYIMAGAVALYIICLLTIIAKWVITVSKYNLRINKLQRVAVQSNPAYSV